MLKSHHLWLRSRPSRKLIAGCGLLILSCLIATLFLWSISQVTLMTNADTSASAHLAVRIEAGFETAYRSDYWTPVHVTIDNTGPEFKGTLSINTFTGPFQSSIASAISPWSFEEPVTLPSNAKRQMMIYAPHYFGYLITRGFVATLRNEYGRTIIARTSQQGLEIKPGNLFVGTLASANANFSAMDKILLPNQTDTISRSSLNASTMPTIATVLDNFDVIILDDFPTETLNAKQISALRTWVNRGGVLIEIGGPSWQRTLKPLPADLLPVTMQGTATLPEKTPLLPAGGPLTPQDQLDPNTLATLLTVSTATIHQSAAFSSSETLLSANNNPLIVQAHQGAGVVCYLAFDPTTSPLTTWLKTTVLWQDIILHTLGNTVLVPDTAESYATGPGQFLTHAGILNLVQPDTLVGPWLLYLLLISYVLVLGPLRLLIQRHLHLPLHWQWRTVLSCIVIFTLLSYAAANFQKNTLLLNNSISLIQINQGGKSAHVTTYMGVYVPDQGDFNLHIPGESLAEPLAQSFLTKNSSTEAKDDIPTTINRSVGQTDLTLHSGGLWALNPIVTEQDHQFHGGLTTHLTLRNNRLVGTITNTLSTSLSDIYVLLPHSFIPIGHIAAGTTQQINLALHSTSPDSGETLADQIALYNKLPAAYFSHTTKNVQEKHVALLSALSSSGFSYPPCEGSCLTHAITSKGNIYVTGGQLPNPNLKNDFDPLLVSGAPATLIGWADQHIEGLADTTINGLTPKGSHTSFIQMPFDLTFSGLLHVPSDFITGNVVNVQSYNVAAILPGMYTMATGNVTFELPLPDTSHTHVSTIEISIPDLIAHPTGPGSGPSMHSSLLRAQLYNWQTTEWDTINLQQDTFTTDDFARYAGPQGRILVEITSRDASQIYFAKPTLKLNGNTRE